MEYKEEQQFSKVFVYILLLVEISILVFLFWESTTAKLPALSLIGLLIPLLVAALLTYCKLKTRINHTGITYHFPPLKKMEVICWEELNKVSVRKYSPILEYGGWGYRYSLGNGRALNVAGNKGLQLEFKSGKKLLIGTQKADELTLFLANLKNRYHIEQIAL